MAFVVAAILTTVVIGLPVTLAIDRDARGAGLVGLSYLYGAGAIWAALFVMPAVHLRWSAASATAALLAVSAAMWGIVLLRRPVLPQTTRTTRWSRWAVVIDVATAYSLVAYTMYATVASVWSWDFWAIWGLKGRVFLEYGGIDWRFLRSPFNEFAHPDYPLLASLNYAWVALINGGWDDRWMALPWMAFTAAVVLVIRSLAANEVPELPASLIGFAAAGVAFTWQPGLADAALVAYASAAVLMIRRFVIFGDSAALRHGAILLGLAASTKNEGIALIATIVGAVLIQRLILRSNLGPLISSVSLRVRVDAAVRDLVRLWPAVAMATPWVVTRSLLHLQTDISRGTLVHRVLERIGGVVPITAGLLNFLPDPWLWLFMLTGVVLMTREARSAERFTFAAVAIQAFWYVAVYFGTPRDVLWHIESSWPRVARHVQLPLLFVVMMALAQAVLRGQTSAHAEARSDLH